MEKMTPVKAIRTAIEGNLGGFEGRKLTTNELKVMTSEERMEVAKLYGDQEGVEIVSAK